MTRRALSKIERSRKDSVSDLRIAHEQKAAAARATLKKWKAEVEEAVKKGRSPPARPVGIDDPGSFVAPRFCVTDVTIERLAVLNNARPRGMLVVIDELTGLFSNMARYNNGSDREFWLQAWNGGYHAVERLSRPPVVIDSLLVGLTGGLQPDKFTKRLAVRMTACTRAFCSLGPSSPTIRLCRTTLPRLSLSSKKLSCG